MAYADRPKTKCTWEGCEKMLAYNPQRKSTMCQKHASTLANRRQENRAQRSETWKRKLEIDPAYRAEHFRRLRDARNLKLEQCPELREKYREIGRRMAAHHPLQVPEDPAERSRRTQRGWSTRLAHVPIDMRETYHGLRKKGVPAAERAEMVLELSDAQCRRHRAQLERQYQDAAQEEFDDA